MSFILGGHGDSGSDGIDIGHDADIGGMDAGGVDIGDADIGSVDVGDADIGSGIGADADGFDAAGPDADMDIGAGHAIDAAHGAETGQAAEAHHHDASDTTGSPSPFSPVVMASAISTFGAVGIISMKGFGLSGLASTFVALGFAGAIGAAIFFGIVKFMYGSQSNSLFSLDDLVGAEADVITTVPAKGLGEIAYTIKGIRYTLAARSLEGCEIRRGTPVIIREIAGNAAVVQQKLTIDDIELEEGVLKRKEDITETKNRN
ncbi:MAG TPA: hypothetical protein PK767_05500 [Clostridiales bacterium]|nr:hypothetical protein [Clostridiales bacterium]HOL91620.1 hypothetical protein [Clostridiales bacterium]HPP35684.1 hypothetical protein [Clostridiales bacterium]